jgi:hypothetical protein
MGRPTTKADLLEAAHAQYLKLQSLIDTLPEDARHAEMAFSESFLAKNKEAHWTRDRNLRDILVHLYEWHRLFIDWVNANQSGNGAPFLPAPYTWKTYGQMNIGLWEKHQDTPLEDALNLLSSSHKEVLGLLENESDTALFSKGYYTWTGGTTLGSYGVSVTSSHYEWAMKKIKQFMKQK